MADRVSVALMASNLLTALDVQPAIGRLITDEELNAKARVAVISFELWQRLSLPRSLQNYVAIRLDGVPYQVVGVMPAEFQIPGGGSDVQVPIEMDAIFWNDRVRNRFSIIARLAKPATPASARAELQAVARTLAATYPETNEGWSLLVDPLQKRVVGPNATVRLWSIFVATAVLVLLSAANLMSAICMTLASAPRDTAMHVVLGGRYRRLLRMSLVRLLPAAIAGFTLGIVVLHWAIVVFGKWLTTNDGGIQYSLSTGLTLLVQTAAAGSALIFVAAAWPLWTLFRQVRTAPAAAFRPGIGGHMRLFFAVSLALQAAGTYYLTGIALSNERRLKGLGDIVLGYDPMDVVTADLTLPQALYPSDEERRIASGLVLQRLQSLPGVDGAAFSTFLPFSTNYRSYGFEIEGRPGAEAADAQWARLGIVTPQFWHVLRTRVLEGRVFRAADGPDAPHALVINKSMARRYWGSRSPVGSRVRFAIAPEDNYWSTVIGVVDDIVQTQLEREIPQMAFEAFDQVAIAGGSVLIRFKPGATVSASTLQRTVSEIGPYVRMGSIRTLSSDVAAVFMAPRLASTGTSIIAVVAILLSALGTYTIVGFSIAEQRRATMIRLALGAKLAHTLRAIAAPLMYACAAGLAAGLLGLLIAVRTGQVSPPDRNAAIIGASVIVLCVVFAAIVVPVRRAHRHPSYQLLRDSSPG